MKSRYEILIVAALLGAAELMWIESHADQASVDEGVNFAKSLQGGVQNLATTTDANTVPAYSGTNLPQVQYYNTQNLNGLQTDATVQLGNGAADEASQYAYQQSLLPSLGFGANDPILLNSSGISTDAMLNPDVLTVPSGNCAVVDVNNPETRIEHCTAWMLPTNHVCNKTLNVDVTWQDQSSCTVGTTFNQVQAGLSDPRDHVFARVPCNPGSGPDVVEFEIHASGSNPGCTGWTRFTASTSQLLTIHTGHVLQPLWFGHCQLVPTFINGQCTGNNCNYTIRYYWIMPWGMSGRTRICAWTPLNLGILGFNGAPSSYKKSASEPIYCVFQTAAVNLNFEKPNITRIPTVTESWTNGCSALEAQL